MKQCVILARRTERRLLAALAVAVAAMAPSARAELVNIVWDASGRFETETKVAPGKFAEVCGPLAKDQTVAWSFKADRPMNFNVHYHVGKQVVYPAKQDAAAEAKGELDATLAQDYCWMWTNQGDSPAALRLTLRR